MKKIFVFMIVFIFVCSMLNSKISTIKTKMVFHEREDDPKYVLSEPSMLFLDDDANFYLLTLGEGTIKKYNKDGIFIKQFCKRGPGPGELSYPPGANVIKKRIFIVDSNFRKHIFDTGGKLIKTEKIPQAGTKNEWLFAYRVKSLSESEWVASGGLHKADRSEQGWTALAVFKETGKKMNIIFSFNRPEVNVLNKRHFFGIYLPDIAWDVNSAGDVLFAREDEYKIYLYKSGKKSQIITEDFKPVEISSDIKKWAKEKEAADPAGFIPLAKNRNIVNQIAIDKTDYIWVLVFSKEFKGLRRYSRDGKFIQSFKLGGELAKTEFENIDFSFAPGYIFFSIYDKEEGQKIFRAVID